jgi:spore germination protein YaaH
MAYEYRGPFSGPGSVAPYDWVSHVAAYAGQQIESDKVLLGLAFFGYDWNTTWGGTLALGYPRAMALAAQEQAAPTFDADQQSLTFDYTADAADQPPAAPSLPPLAHQITTRSTGPCDITPPAQPPVKRPPPPPAGSLQTHQVWLEDSQSATARLALTEADQLRGVAAWRLGFEDPNVWPLLDQWRALSAPAP